MSIMSNILDAFCAMFNCKQSEGESENLNEYTRRFKAARDILVSQLGAPIKLGKYVATMDGYDPLNQGTVAQLTKQAGPEGACLDQRQESQETLQEYDELQFESHERQSQWQSRHVPMQSQHWQEAHACRGCGACLQQPCAFIHTQRWLEDS